MLLFLAKPICDLTWPTSRQVSPHFAYGLTDSAHLRYHAPTAVATATLEVEAHASPTYICRRYEAWSTITKNNVQLLHARSTNEESVHSNENDRASRKGRERERELAGV